MSLEKIYFDLQMRRKLGKIEFLILYIVLLRVELKCTIYASRMGLSAGASQVAIQRANVQFQKFFFACFCTHSQSKIYFFQGHVLPTPFLSKNSRCDLERPTVPFWKDLNLFNIHIVSSEDHQDFLYRFFSVKVTLFTA